MYLTQKLLDEWAGQVLEAFDAQGVPPAETVKQISIANNLDIDQIRELVRSSNVKIRVAHPTLKFEVVSAEQVIAELQPQQEAGEEMMAEPKISMLSESAFEKSAQDYLTNRNLGFQKQASRSIIDTDNLVSALNACDKRIRQVRQDRVMAMEDMKKHGERLVDMLADEARRDGGISKSYTAAVQMLPGDPTERFFKVAHALLCDTHVQEYPAPRMVKLASAPDPCDFFLNELNRYLLAGRRLVKIASELQSLESEKGKVSGLLRRILEKAAK